MKRIFFFLLLVLTCQYVSAQSDAMDYAKKVNKENLKSVVKTLSSDKFGGRKTGEEGGKLTEQFICDQLELHKIKWGNKNSYRQKMAAFHKTKSNKYFEMDDFNYEKCFSFRNESYHDTLIVNDTIVFAGFGIYDAAFNDFAGVDISGKIVMVIDETGPYNKFGVKCHNARKNPNYEYIIEQKPKAIFKIQSGFNDFSVYSSKSIYFEKEKGDHIHGIPLVKINELLANKILEKTKRTIKEMVFRYENSCEPHSFEFMRSIRFNADYNFGKADISNIVAIVEGDEYKDEYVVLCAHYDHIGQNYREEVYPGANDNATGVSVLLETARLMNIARKKGNGPKRNVIFIFTAAEEVGLLGSKYYVDHPLYPLEKTVAGINVDMVGRVNSSVDTLDNTYVYALTESKGYNSKIYDKIDSISFLLNDISAFKTEGGTYNSLYSRSDQYSFNRTNIPFVFFTDKCMDDYHSVNDTYDKIEPEILLKRSRLVFLTAWELANSKGCFKAE